MFEEVEYDDTVVEALEGEEIDDEVQFAVEIENATELKEISLETEKQKTTRKPYAPRKPGGGRQIHQCQCGIIFSSQHRLTNHKRVKHEFVPESELLGCEICGKKWVEVWKKEKIKKLEQLLQI